MHHKCFWPVVSASLTDSERICFLVPNKVHLWELVSHREFSYSYLSFLPSMSITTHLSEQSQRWFILIYNELESRAARPASDLFE